MEFLITVQLFHSFFKILLLPLFVFEDHSASYLHAYSFNFDRKIMTFDRYTAWVIGS